MARAVVWTDSAWRDLEEAADYIAQDSRYYAASLVREVRDAARRYQYWLSGAELYLSSVIRRFTNS